MPVLDQVYMARSWFVPLDLVRFSLGNPYHAALSVPIAIPLILRTSNPLEEVSTVSRREKIPDLFFSKSVKGSMAVT